MSTWASSAKALTASRLGRVLSRPILRSVVADKDYRWAISPVEQALGLTESDLLFGPVPGDVRRYGDNAVPGTTDMTTALQRALNVAAAGGGRLIVPPGRYRITSGLTWTWANHGLWVQGDGYDTQEGGSQIEYDGPAGGTLLHLAGAAGVHPGVIRGIAFKNVSGHADITCVRLTGVRDFTIKESYFEGFEKAVHSDMLVGYTSIQHATEFCYLVDCYFVGNKHGFYANVGDQHLWFIERCRFHAQTDSSIFCEYVNDPTVGETYFHHWVIRDNWFYDDSSAEAPIRIQGTGKSLLIDGNYFEYNVSGTPKPLIKVSTPGGQHAGLTVSNNWMQGYPHATGGVIEVANVDGLRVKGNTWTRSYGGAPPAGAAFVKFDNALVTNYDIEFPALAFGAELLNTVRTSTGALITDKKVDTYGYEGTWTPAIAFGGAAVGVAYGAAAGRYRRQGRLVTVLFRIALTNKGSSTGAVTITGLPFALGASQASYGAAGAISSAGAFNSLTGALSLAGVPGESQIRVQQWAAGGQAALPDSAVTNTTVIHGTFSYMTD